MNLSLSETNHLLKALSLMGPFIVARDYNHEGHEQLQEKLKDHKLKLTKP